MGSLEPLSSSSMGRRWWRRPTFWLPSMPNTDAESVDDIVEANSNDGSSAKWILVHDIPDSQNMNTPVIRAVSSTPAVESTSPGTITGRMALSLVPMPPEKSIMHRAIMPMNCAVCMSENLIPSPSMPNPIPTSRNMSNRGRPMR